jgi:hypothetical protein
MRDNQSLPPSTAAETTFTVGTLTEVESWREIQSRNIEFIMKRLREPLK